MASPAPPNERKPHIMISYNWGVQPFAKYINDLLTRNGIRTWFDINGDMKVDVTKSMGVGVAYAAVVLCILTEEYEKSFACEKEFGAAFAGKKSMVFLKYKPYQPSSAITICMGASKYHTFQDDPTSPEKMKLVDEKDFLQDITALIPVGHPAHLRVQKRILMVGCAGVGKSSITALLINGIAHSGNKNAHDIYISRNSREGSWKTSEYSNDKYIITDTMGVGSEKQNSNPFGTAGAIQNLKDFLVKSKKGYHYIFFVVLGIRVTAANSLLAYRAFYETLFPDLADRFVIILTHHREAVVDPTSLDYINASLPGIEDLVAVSIPGIKDDQSSAELKLQETALQRLNAFLDGRPEKELLVPGVSTIERYSFGNLMKKLYALFGAKWNDEMQKTVDALSFSAPTSP